jgi:hypothetical protein
MIAVTLTFPEHTILKIDQDRGEINRSKFVVGLIRKAYESDNYISQKDGLTN